MAEPTSSNNNDGGAGKPNNSGGGAEPPEKPENNDLPDLSKLDADQLAGVFENPNLYQHTRFKKLTDKAAEADRLAEEAKKAEEKSLEDNKRFEDLANKRGSELEQKEQEIKNMKIDQALTNKLVGQSVVDLEAALKLIDRSDIEIDKSGSVAGVEKAIEALKSGKAYLFGEGDGSNSSLGSSTSNNQGKPSGPAKFKRSQLRDPAFYKENREAIIAAQKAGLIEDDIS